MAKSVPASDLRTKTDAELVEIIRSTENQLFTAKFQNHTNRLDDTSTLRRLRHEIARARTVLTERKSAATATAGSES